MSKKQLVVSLTYYENDETIITKTFSNLMGICDYQGIHKGTIQKGLFTDGCLTKDEAIEQINNEMKKAWEHE